MNKKALSQEVVPMIIRLGLTLAVVMIIVWIVNSNMDEKLDLKDLRFYPYAERFLFSPNCFIVSDEYRSYPGIIDKTKFTKENLDECMSIIEHPIAAKLTLTQDVNEDIIFFNEEYYEDLIPLTFSKDYFYVSKKYYVLTQTEDNREPSNLFIELVWRQ